MPADPDGCASRPYAQAQTPRAVAATDSPVSPGRGRSCSPPLHSSLELTWHPPSLIVKSPTHLCQGQVLTRASIVRTSHALFGDRCALPQSHLHRGGGRVSHLQVEHHGGNDRHPQTKESHAREPAQRQHQAPKRCTTEDARLVADGEQPGGGAPRHAGPL